MKRTLKEIVLIVLLIMIIPGCLEEKSDSNKTNIQEPTQIKVDPKIIKLKITDSSGGTESSKLIPSNTKLEIGKEILENYIFDKYLGKGNIFIIRGEFDNWTSFPRGPNGWYSISSDEVILTEKSEILTLDLNKVINRASIAGAAPPKWSSTVKLVVFKPDGTMESEVSANIPLSELNPSMNPPISATVSVRDKNIIFHTDAEGNVDVSKLDAGTWYLDISSKGYIHKELLINIKNAQTQTFITALTSMDKSMTGIFKTHNIPCSEKLGGKRSIIVYLPSDYEISKDKTYPVLYMNDGQDLFTVRSAYGNVEWRVDDTIENYMKEGKSKGVIVVGINNTPNRNIEYPPWAYSQYGENLGGLGVDYTEFVAKTLKPFIDKNYRTKPEPENTGIAGSSFGGISAVYCGIEYSDVFGIIGGFSTSFDCKDREFLRYLDAKPTLKNTRIYLDVGNEGYMVPDMNNVYNKLIAKGYPESMLKKVYDSTGSHNQTAWQKRFPAAFLWMFDGK